MYQAALNHGTKVDFYDPIVNIACDTRFRLKFKEFGCLYRPDDRSVNDQMGYTDLPLDPRLLTDDQGTRLVVSGPHATANLAIYTQATGERDIPIDSGSGADQAVDPALGLVWLFAEHPTSA